MKKQSKLYIPPQFERQSLLSDEQYIWLGGPKVSKWGYLWLEWKYKDPIIPLAILVVVVGIILITGKTERLGEILLVLCLMPIFLYNILVLRTILGLFMMHIDDPGSKEHYAMSQYHIFYRVPGKYNIIRVPFRDIKDYKVLENNDGTATIKFYAKQNFKFEHVKNIAKLTALIDKLIRRNHRLAGKPYTNE